jgi:hypothetical protein
MPPFDWYSGCKKIYKQNVYFKPIHEAANGLRIRNVVIGRILISILVYVRQLD